MISARNVSSSSRHSVNNATTESTSTSPWRAPMIRISSTLAGRRTQNQGYPRACTCCATRVDSILAVSPPHRRKFSLSMVRMNSLPSTSVQNLCVYREWSLCRYTTTSCASRRACCKADEKVPSKKRGSSATEPYDSVRARLSAPDASPGLINEPELPKMKVKTMRSTDTPTRCSPRANQPTTLETRPRLGAGCWPPASAGPGC
mmetsp:Transcript_134879/g.246094  ORF Transcript_134879/g.246094 Transcript_134879/m.246094 type:complete len:204 (-) Transcript_134879:283-894(-)